MWLFELQGFYVCEAHLFIRDFEVAQGKIFRCGKVFTVSTVTDKHFLMCCPVVFFFPVIQVIHELQFIKKTVHGFELSISGAWLFSRIKACQSATRCCPGSSSRASSCVFFFAPQPLIRKTRTIRGTITNKKERPISGYFDFF